MDNNLGTVSHSSIKFNVVELNGATEKHSESKIKLSELMWNETLDIALKTYKTAYVQGLRDGSLSPHKFGVFDMQDAVFLEKQSDALNIASQQESTTKFGIQFQEVLQGQAKRFMGYATGMYEDWQLTGSSGVKLNSACEVFTEYKIKVARTM